MACLAIFNPMKVKRSKHLNRIAVTMMNCNLSPGKSNKLSLRLMQHAPLQSNSTPHSFHQSLTVKRIQAEFGQCNIIRKTGDQFTNWSQKHRHWKKPQNKCNTPDKYPIYRVAKTLHVYLGLSSTQYSQAGLHASLTRALILISAAHF